MIGNTPSILNSKLPSDITEQVNHFRNSITYAYAVPLVRALPITREPKIHYADQ